nr:hypothetical protein [Lentilactobacillus otakiensis]
MKTVFKIVGATAVVAGATYIPARKRRESLLSVLKTRLMIRNKKRLIGKLLMTTLSSQ